MPPILSTEECYGKNCVFDEFCSHAIGYKTCRPCSSLLPWCNENQTKFYVKFPRCGHICKIEELSAKLNATTQELNAARSGGQELDFIHYILIGAVLILVVLLSITHFKSTQRRLKQALAVICRKEKTPAIDQESIELVPKEGEPRQDPPASTDEDEEQANRTPPEPSAPAQDEDEETLSNDSAAATAAAASGTSAPNEASTTQPESNQQLPYPTVTQDGTADASLHRLALDPLDPPVS